ncbi:MAG: hypothetical protein ACXABD_20480 [Candidatus Thorarchaeota archaeon]|jgi:hypothetical protein
MARRPNKGDRVRVLSTAETEHIGIAGKQALVLATKRMMHLVKLNVEGSDTSYMVPEDSVRVI